MHLCFFELKQLSDLPKTHEVTKYKLSFDSSGPDKYHIWAKNTEFLNIIKKKFKQDQIIVLLLL